MTILVTGASGFVGGAILRHLASGGHTVRAVVRRSDQMAPLGGVEVRPLGDLSGTIDWRPLLAGCESVVHAAGLAHQPPGTTEADLMRVNAEAAGRLAAAAAEAGIARFVLISSIRAISGPVSTAALTEADEPAPTDAYGRSKLAGEAAVHAAFPAATILRPPAVHGARAKGNMNSLATWARSPWPLPLAGLDAPRSLVSDRNLASAAAFALATPEARGATFHVDDGAPSSLPAIVAAMRRALGRPDGLFGPPDAVMRLALGLLPRTLSARFSGGLILSSGRLTEAGWRPVETTENGLARLVLGRES